MQTNQAPQLQLQPQKTVPLALDPEADTLYQEVTNVLERMDAMKQALRVAEATIQSRSSAFRVAEMTRRPSPTAQVWAKANDSRRECINAWRRQQEAIRKVGQWDKTRDLWWRGSRAWVAVGRLYFSAVMHSLHVLEVLDLTRDVHVLEAWSAAAAL